MKVLKLDLKTTRNDFYTRNEITMLEACDKPGPYAGSVEKEISEVSSNPC